ncbi:uncharacterized protein LOC111597319 isoform X2 [Drosophila hydei]|uniref:Uncharacterized protein LOC111597319 isoform X2 n=1 Tax=Drosophila hydei TaxID=7224 RepID=A0A6J1LM54_DROHY|nr:uncharacterized protein LOC111597319 isoform X2 [Drosophila hydei]
MNRLLRLSETRKCVRIQRMRMFFQSSIGDRQVASSVSESERTHMPGPQMWSHSRQTNADAMECLVKGATSSE